VIKFHFSRRPDQGEPSGFDLGDIVVSGDKGSITTEGHSPDQGVMIYLSLTLLLDHLASLHDSKKAVEFVGVDSSFAIWFRPTKRGIKISSGNVLIGHVEAAELFREVLRAVEGFSATELHILPEGDAGRADLSASLEQFRHIAGA
jgi:hypothetical protein